MKKVHIIKAHGPIPSGWELRDYCYQHNINVSELVDEKIVIKWKQGKHKKFSRFHLDGYQSYPCDCCGEHTWMSYRAKGIKKSIEVF